MTAFRFVSLVCDLCFARFDPGTALTEADARADAVDRGWTLIDVDEDRCGACSGGATRDVIAELEFGAPIPVPAL